MNPEYKRWRIRRQDVLAETTLNAQDENVRRHRHKVCQRLLVLTLALGTACSSASAASDSKPYDDRLLRLSELLGAIHYLRELCSANEGQYWRERMRELMDAEGSTALRRAKLTRAFNQGYRSYSRTYNTCSPSAQTAITRFLSEGSDLSDSMLKAFPN